jgi:2-methylfumaryl-CoA isomerase
MFKLCDQPGLGRYPVPSLPVRFRNAGRSTTKLASKLGQHTVEILSKVVGLDDTEIAQLFDRNMVA